MIFKKGDRVKLEMKMALDTYSPDFREDFFRLNGIFTVHKDYNDCDGGPYLAITDCSINAYWSAVVTTFNISLYEDDYLPEELWIIL